MNWVANLERGDVVLEPSAGVGGIAVFAKNAGVKSVILTELRLPGGRRCSKRWALTACLPRTQEQISNILPKDIKPTVIIMNPPFSASAGRMKGQRSPENLIMHIGQALSRLEPNGRLVVLTGKGLFGESKTFNEWLDNIDVTNDVVADITISGEGYKKMDNYPPTDNRLIVIDKRKTNAILIKKNSKGHQGRRSLTERSTR